MVGISWVASAAMVHAGLDISGDCAVTQRADAVRGKVRHLEEILCGIRNNLPVWPGSAPWPRIASHRRLWYRQFHDIGKHVDKQRASQLHARRIEFMFWAAGTSAGNEGKPGRAHSSAWSRKNSAWSQSSTWSEPVWPRSTSHHAELYAYAAHIQTKIFILIKFRVFNK